MTIIGEAACAWRDNVLIERLWRTIKNEELYLRSNTSLSEARAGIGRHLGFYNNRRRHSSLGGKTPETCSDQPNHLCAQRNLVTCNCVARHKRAKGNTME